MPVTLTFDNGPAPGITEQVLDVLAARGMLATFFVVGSRLAQPGARRIAERAAAEGHWIGNHSMTHSTPLGERPDPSYAATEIDGAQWVLADLSHERRFFRPIGGGTVGPHLLSDAAVDLLLAGGYTCVLWNSVPHDWDDPSGWVETGLGDVESLEHAVVVLHDVPTGAMPALPEFLDRLEAVGVEVVQDFPTAVIPIERGSSRGLDGLLGRPPGADDRRPAAAPGVRITDSAVRPH